MTRYRRYSNPYSIDIQRYSIYHRREERRKALSVGDEFVVTIEDMDSSGCGIARKYGYTLVVPKAVPGEKVVVRVIRVKGREARVSVIKRLAEPRR